MNITEADLCLRKIEEADIAAIVKLEEELFADPWDARVFREEIAQRSEFYKEVGGEKKETKHSYLLEYQGEIVGFFLGWAIFDEYTVMNIGISKRYQGRGLGSYLFRHLLVKAAELYCFTIYLEVRVSNISAIKLYKKFHFENIGIRKGYYQHPLEDARVMSLDLLNDMIEEKEGIDERL